MKYVHKIVLVISILLFISGCAALHGPKAPESEKSVESIVSLDGKSKDDIYISANGWFVDNFNSAESVIQFQDKDAGKIMGKYTFEVQESTYFFRIKSTISIDIKDNKARMRIYDPMVAVVGDVLNGTYPHTPSYSSDITVPVMAQAKSRWSELLADLEVNLGKEADW